MEERTGQPTKRRWDFGHIALGVLAIALAATSLWLWMELADERQDAMATVAQSEQRAQDMLTEQERTSEQALMSARARSAEAQAEAFAIAIQPVIALKSQVPEITDRSIQAAAENLAQQGDYSFVAVTDATGNVIASSDLALIGRQAENLTPGVRLVDGENQAVTRIGDEGANLGWVIVTVRNEN